MASGIPVVGPAAGGVGELVEPDTGILVEPGYAEALAEGIDRLYRLDMAAMGAAGRRKVVDGYEWNRVIQQLMHHYAGLFATHQRPLLGLETSYAGK